MSKKQKETIDNDSDPEKQYQVEVILAARAVRKGKWQYLVKWHGYPDSENSWEPGNGLTTCKALLSRFWQDVEIDSSQRKATPRGSIVHASDSWIQCEKQNFETNIAPTPGKEELELEDSDASSSDSNVPLSAKLALNEDGTKAKYLKRKRIPSLTSYSDEPLPLAVETKRKRVKVSGRRNTSTTGPHRQTSENNPPNVTDLSVHTGPGDPSHSPPTMRPQICNEAVVSSSEVLGIAPPNHAMQNEPSINSTRISPPINQMISLPSPDSPVLSPKPKAPTHRRPVRVKELTYSEVPGADETIAFGNSTKRRIMQGSALQPLTPTTVSKDKPADAPKNSLIASSTRQPPGNDNTLAEVDAFLDTIVLPDAPTNYRWEGQLICYALSKDCGRVSVIAHSTSCSDGTRLAQVLPTTLAALTFSSFYHTSDVVRQLKDRKASVTAGLISDTTSKQAIDALVGYATENSLCLIMVCEPGLDSLADVIIFFPPGSSLRSYFNISEPLLRPQLFVVLVSTSPPSSPRSKHHLNIPNQPKLNEYRYQQSIHLLKFPEWLHTLLTSRKSNCCIWYDGSATCDMRRHYVFEANRTNHDTWLLTKILEKYTRLNPSPKDFYYSDASVVFVHVSAIRTLHRLPKFVNRLWKQSDMAVVTYGTHYSVPPSMWGIKLIYPAGGLVTFSPNAFLQDPTGVFDLAMNIARHRMWSLWLTPLTLGCIIRTSYHDQDPVAQFDDGNFVFRFLLDAIDDGKFSFCSHPPSESSSVADVQEWVAEQEVVVAGGPRELLEYALHVYDSFIQSDSDSESVLRALCSEVRSLQLHPTLMQEYRRFVIVCTETEIQTHENDQFEWRTTDTFHFNYRSMKAH